LEHDKWEVRLVEISYPKGYKKRYLHSTLRLGSEGIIYSVRHYETVFHFLTNIPQFFEPPANENFIRIFSKYINKYEWQSNDLFKSCLGENSIMVKVNLVSYFPSRAYDSIDDLAETIINTANSCSSAVKHSIKQNINIAHPQPVYVYTDIIKPNLVGYCYVRLLTSVHHPSAKGYNTFDYLLYKLVEQSYIGSISIRLVMKTG